MVRLKQWIYRSRQCCLVLLIGFGIGATRLIAESGGPLYEAADLLVNDFSQDLPEIANLTTKVGITTFTTSENIDNDVKTYVYNKLLAASKPGTTFHFIACKECTSVRAETDGDQVYIKKGIESQDRLQKVANSVGFKSSAEVNFSYTGTRALMMVSIMNVSTSEIIWSKTYSTRILSLARTGFRLSVDINQLIGLEQKGYPGALSIFAAERIYGFGEFGLVVQGSQAQGDIMSDVQVGPMLRLNYNELTSKPWSWGALLWSFRCAYGWYNKTQRDLTIGIGPKLEIGTIYHLTLEYMRGFSMNANKSSTTATSNTDTATATTPPQDHLPGTLVFGFGFDIG